ncbi:DUF47 domain-containing protein [Puia sp. P3]|uniref:DUF47 domain-containing protein n=1 Tax=Puia sp. P3 TaxID=3423952 RepID=UPI003D67D3E8
MGFNSILQLFTPKDRVFYSLFEEVADSVGKMGKLMKEFAAESDADKRTSILSRMEDQEHINDDLTHRIFTELGRNFITPFDREDIHYLASALDDICDYIYATGKRSISIRSTPTIPASRKWRTLSNRAQDRYRSR